MAVPWDVWGVGVAMGSAVGLVGGYQLRKLVVHIQEYRSYRSTKRDISREHEHDKVVAIVKREKPPVIPLKARTFKEEQSVPVVNPDRDDVIAALMGSGYKKEIAIKATDACSPVERAHGLQQWTIAAFKNAHGAK